MNRTCWSPSDPSGDPGQHLCVPLGANVQPAANAEGEQRPPSRGIQGDRQSWWVSKARRVEGCTRKAHLDPRQRSELRTSPHQETQPLSTRRAGSPCPPRCWELCDSSAPPVAGCPSPGERLAPLYVRWGVRGSHVAPSSWAAYVLPLGPRDLTPGRYPRGAPAYVPQETQHKTGSDATSLRPLDRRVGL